MIAERLSGRGSVSQAGSMIAEVDYDLAVELWGLGMFSITGLITVVRGENALADAWMSQALLILHLVDGRRLEFYAEGGAVSEDYGVRPIGGFL